MIREIADHLFDCKYFPLEIPQQPQQSQQSQQLQQPEPSKVRAVVEERRNISKPKRIPSFRSKSRKLRDRLARFFMFPTLGRRFRSSSAPLLVYSGVESSISTYRSPQLKSTPTASPSLSPTDHAKKRWKKYAKNWDFDLTKVNTNTCITLYYSASSKMYETAL